MVRHGLQWLKNLVGLWKLARWFTGCGISHNGGSATRRSLRTSIEAGGLTSTATTLRVLGGSSAAGQSGGVLASGPVEVSGAPSALPFFRVRRRTADQRSG